MSTTKRICSVKGSVVKPSELGEKRGENGLFTHGGSNVKFHALWWSVNSIWEKIIVDDTLSKPGPKCDVACAIKKQKVQIKNKNLWSALC